MMTHDPYQTHPLAAYAGGIAPYGLPSAAMPPYFNPAFGGGYGIHPQHLQAINPLAYGLQNPYPGPQNPWQNPGLQNPGPQYAFQNPLAQHALLQAAWQNPLLAASLQNPMFNPFIAAQGWGQQQTQFPYPLAPQTLAGAGIGQPFGQINPLAQAALRQATGYGANPLGGF